MNYFIETNGSVIINLLRDDYTEIPNGAIAISESDGIMLSKMSNFGDFEYVGGTVAYSIAPIRRLKIAEIDAAYNAAISVISATYPETERNSWAKQESEARAWTASNALASTPLLTAIATARGSTLADICTRVIANADAYAVYAGGVIGKRQAKMIAIAAATTISELEVITW